ncbi:DNA methylase [Polynucleobacter sp. SHI8]|uniref:alpha-ketoglutarate-dependent dioxygenase AlkB family protein n=1 Tax=unclassified Polynucleobacter TaxID=2640945 RepID=UPI0024933141|nr:MULTISPECIES: alpha-ketoglutarate-dependent dioxygenase AlkB [unclassified Polynucleobacter]BDW10422.1 DNA methylase [Polynucleobacter sp. SHI2]BDW12868.1 DNA methylase [Polynucleobacter sp. SHI8]
MTQSLLFEPFSKDCLLNLLPKNGSVYYYPEVFDEASSSNLLNVLQESLLWSSDQLMMFGKRITTRRKVAWVGDPNCPYTYSGVQKNPQAWTADLLLIKERLEKISASEFNSCLLNLYHDGNDGMGWHSDDEKELDANAPIASLSLGATRKFAFKNKEDKGSFSIFLENGSALIMYPPTQEFWQHSLLKTKKTIGLRINLTFRKIIPHDKNPLF